MKTGSFSTLKAFILEKEAYAITFPSVLRAIDSIYCKTSISYSYIVEITKSCGCYFLSSK
jgi:hypothetical protein